MIKIQPVISEKTARLAKSGKFTVEVPPGLSKTQIVRKINEIFALNPIDVRTLVGSPRIEKRARGKVRVRREKKAIITLKGGELFPGFEFINEEKEKKGKRGGGSGGKK